MSSNCEDEETDLYADLPNFQFDQAFKKLENDKAYLQNKVEVLAAKLEEVKKENEKLAAKVKTLGKNISCLYRTAQREIERKEKIIADLRKERDDLLFRRGMQDCKPSYNKRPSRKQLTPTKKVRNGGLKRILEDKGKTDVVNDGRITPSSKEYEEISSLVAVDSKENTVVKNGEESIPKVIDLTDNETNVSCSKDAKSSKKAEKSKLLGFNSGGSSDVEILDGEECRPPCDDRKGDTIKSQEPRTVRDAEEIIDKGGKSTADTNDGIVDPLVTKELHAASLSQASDQVSEEEKSFSSTGSNKNEVTSPVKDKVSVHMTSEDCGFGRRRIRRVVKPTVSPATPVSSVPVEKGVKRSLEETTEVSSEILKNPQLIAVEVKQADPRVHKRRCMDGTIMSQSQSDKLETIKEDCGSNSEKDVSQTVSSCRTDSGDLLVLKYDAAQEKERNESELVHVPNISDITKEVGKKNKTEECDNLNDKESDDEKRERMVRDVVKNYGSSFGVCAFGEKTDHVKKGSESASLSEPDGESKVSKIKAAVSGGSRTIVKDCSHSRVEENAHCEHGSSCMSPHLSPNHSYASDNRSPRHSPCSRMTDDEHNSSRRSWDRERVSGSCSNNDRRPRLSGEGSNCGFRKSFSKVRGKNDPEYQGRRDRKEYSDRGSRQGIGKGDGPIEKSGDHERGSYRSRDCSRDRGRGRSRERSTDRTWDRSRDGGSRERSRDRGRSWDRSRGRSRERSKDRERNRSWDRSREKSRDRSWDRGRKSSRDRSWDRGRGRSCDRGRGRSGDRQSRRSRDRSNDRDRRCRDYDGDRERGRDERDRGYDRLRDRERGREYDRRRESDRMRNYNRGRDSFRGRDPDRGQDLDRSRDSDRVRETSRGSKDSDKSRDGGRERDGKRTSGCHSTSKESSPVRDEGKDSSQNKSDEKPGNGRFDLREKLNDSVSSASGKCGGKEWNGYKDWDKPTNEAGEKNVSWGAKRSVTHESNGIKSPDKPNNADPREIRPFISEWD